MRKEINILLLAAGPSSRLGQSKQLLRIDGDALLHKSVKTALSAEVNHVFVVLGSNETAHREVIKDLPVTIISNPSWKDGIGSSLKVGLKKLLIQFPKTEAVMILVCDQPYITPEYLRKIISAYHSSECSIIASRYVNTTGVPALFGSAHFGDLCAVTDDEGAKKIIQKHLNSALTIDFPQGAIDLDTPSDVRDYLEKNTGAKS